MKRFVEFPLKGQPGSVLVEVHETEEEAGYERAARPGELAARAGQSFQAALEKVQPIALAVLSSMRGIGEGLEGVDVEFGLRLSAQAGVILTSGGVEANFKVALKWKRE